MFPETKDFKDESTFTKTELKREAKTKTKDENL
jgi:hypothetical protein